MEAAINLSIPAPPAMPRHQHLLPSQIPPTASSVRVCSETLVSFHPAGPVGHGHRTSLAGPAPPLCVKQPWVSAGPGPSQPWVSVGPVQIRNRPERGPIPSGFRAPSPQGEGGLPHRPSLATGQHPRPCSVTAPHHSTARHRALVYCWTWRLQHYTTAPHSLHSSPIAVSWRPHTRAPRRARP